MWRWRRFSQLPRIQNLLTTNNKIENYGIPDVTIRKETDDDETNAGPDGPDDQRHGADRPRSVSLAHLSRAVPVRRAHGRLRHVDRSGLRAALVFRHGHQLCGTVQALPRGRLVLPLRGAGLPVQDARL